MRVKRMYSKLIFIKVESVFWFYIQSSRCQIEKQNTYNESNTSRSLKCFQ